MKTVKRKITFLLGLSLVVGLMFTACDKDDPKPQEKLLYPTKITDYDGDVVDGITTFEYDDNNHIYKIMWSSGDYYNQFEYNAEGKLLKVLEYIGSQVDSYDSLEYNANGQLIKIQEYRASGEKRSSYTLEYDTHGNVIKKSEYNTDGILYSYNIYEHDINWNMINQKFYWKDHETGTILTDKYEETSFQYDDKNNVYKSWNLPFIWSETHINNVLEETYTKHYDGGESRSYTYTYIYNEDNYPIEYTEGDERYVIEYQEL